MSRYSLEVRRGGEWVALAHDLTSRDCAQQRIVRGDDGLDTEYRFVPYFPPIRTERDGFTYVSDCTYATDPATIARVKVGDTVRVTDPKPFDYLARGGGASATWETVVENVARDEFGIYLNTGLPTYANTITHGVEIVRRTLCGGS